MCYHFGDIVKIENLNFENILINCKHTKIFWFMALHIKL